MLFPGARHRYAPHRRTGWVEHWIECRGGAFNFACDAGSAQPEQPSSSEISDLFTSIHALAQPDTARNQPRISTLDFSWLFTRLLTKNYIKILVRKRLLSRDSSLRLFF
ncbi:AraC family ligand binding domain-containing protein (plasmid) [Rhizobium leguminosarum]|nr:AraC family ligand binding domain-containing protein [Rhizobium leguminosarum]